MKFVPDLLISDFILYPAVPVFFLVVVYVMRDIYRQTQLYQFHSHHYLGGLVALTLLWFLTARSNLGLEFHFHGAMLFTLLFGWRHAFIGMVLIQLFTSLYPQGGEFSLSYFALNNLVFVLLPVVLANTIKELVERYLPPNFFVFVFVTAFFGSAITLLLMLLSSALILILFSDVTWLRLWKDFLIFTPLMMFSEAFMTGMLSTMLALFKPHWVRGFDEERYFK